ncbi:14906_t:CDS:2, partial [Gigaspora rosea]
MCLLPIRYEGVCSLCDMGSREKQKNGHFLVDTGSPTMYICEEALGVIKTKKEKKLKLYKNLKKESYHDLKWKDYLTNKIISDDSDAVKILTDNYDIFMEPKHQMLPPTLPLIQGMCDIFTWKESNDILSRIAEEDLKVLGESWKNPAFSLELRSSQNEGTYVTHKKRVASSERKEEGHLEKKPDMMFILNQEEVSYELVYAEFSCLVCTEQKKEKDDIKFWRETNDGMDWVRNKYKPAKDKFGIIGIQVAGNGLKLNVLVRDEAN